MLVSVSAPPGICARDHTSWRKAIVHCTHGLCVSADHQDIGQQDAQPAFIINKRFPSPPDIDAFKVYCDMSGSGWTLVGMVHTASSGGVDEPTTWFSNGFYATSSLLSENKNQNNHPPCAFGAQRFLSYIDSRPVRQWWLFFLKITVTHEQQRIFIGIAAMFVGGGERGAPVAPKKMVLQEECKGVASVSLFTFRIYFSFLPLKSLVCLPDSALLACV